jgi:acyl-CoA thioester hydrolase
MVASDSRATITALMPTPHELQIRVRYAETDQMGVVHHASYLIYMEEGRTALMRQLGFPYEGVEERGFAMAVRKLDVRYRQAARYGDQIRVLTTVERFRSASILYGYEMTRVSDGVGLLTGTSEVACLELRKGFRPAPLPDDIRKALEAYLGPG